MQSFGYVGLSGLPLQSSSSNCLVLIRHRQLDNFKDIFYFSQLYVDDIFF